MADIVGQMSLFDMAEFLGFEPESKPEPPKLFVEGQIVWLVTKGDVTKWICTGENWICGDNGDERGYRLKSVCYNVIWNKDMGRRAFLQMDEAVKKAAEYLLTHQVIRKEEFEPLEVKAWTYLRKVDNRQMYAWYAILPDGKVYMKEFMTYHHIRDFGTVDKARKQMEKQFLKQREFEHDEITEVEDAKSVIHFKNMYKCSDRTDWDYAEAGYNG